MQETAHKQEADNKVPITPERPRIMSPERERHQDNGGSKIRQLTRLVNRMMNPEMDRFVHTPNRPTTLAMMRQASNNSEPRNILNSAPRTFGISNDLQLVQQSHSMTPMQGLQGVSGRKQCNCKNSKCLKLYCECFASGEYCKNCNCIGCCNNPENEAIRSETVAAIVDRNPTAFRPKIAQNPRQQQNLNQQETQQYVRRFVAGNIDASKHAKGCACKKSGCLKKYCECFQAGIFCQENCRCNECKNYDGSLD